MRATLSGLITIALLGACGTPDVRDERDEGRDAGSKDSDGGTGDAGTTDLEPAGMKGATEAHNAVRRSVSPAPAEPLGDLAWSPTIAAVAQAYAENCEFEHSNGDYGENLYASTGRPTPQTVVNSWASEDAYYDYSNNTCDQGKQCGHYTQVVWADTTHVGCGMAECNQNSPFGSTQKWFLWVCNYDPPGNFIGEKPY